MSQTTFSMSALIVILVGSLSFSSTLQASTAANTTNSQNRAESSKPRVTRGASMDSVEKKLGAPEKKHSAVGKPPITRWDYARYSVFFEHNHVLHVVQH